MQKELRDHYMGRTIDLSVEGYGASQHTRIRVNGLDVSDQVARHNPGAPSTDLGLVIQKVRKLIDGSLL